MISCANLTKRFGDLVAVDNISLQISGGICAVIGPNGAGKSTLLKLLTGLLQPDAGEVRIGAQGVPPQSLEARRIMGVLPEDLGLFNSLTVKEHMELAGPIYGIGKDGNKMRTESLLRVLRLTHASDLFLDQCSHGMRKKTALALAMLHNPKVLFLDEPFEGIDPEAAVGIRDLLRAISQRGITVLFTSHMLSIVDRLATEIMLIQSGRIVWHSTEQPASRPVEELYFELVKKSPTEDLEWLRSSPS